MSRESVFSLKPRGIGEVLDLTFRIYRYRFPVFATVGLCVALLNTTSSLILQIVLHSNEIYSDPTTDPIGFLIAVYSVLPLMMAASLLIYSAGSTVVFAMVRDVLTGRGDDGSRNLLAGFKRVPSMFFTAVFSWIIIFFGSLLCLLPGLVASILFALAVPVAFLENRSPFSSLGRSVELIHNRGPKGIGSGNNAVRVLVVGLVTLVIWYALSVFAGIPQAAAVFIGMSGDQGLVMSPLGPSPLSMTWMLLLYFIGAILQGPFLGITLIPWAVLYFDIRTRHEGLDIEEKILELRTGPKGGAT